MENIDLFQVVITVLLALSMFLLNSFKGSIDKVTNSINLLNTNVATLLANDENKDKAIETNHKEIEKLRVTYHEMAQQVTANNGKVYLLENKLESLEERMNK